MAADRWTRFASATAVVTVAVIAAATLTPVSSAQAAPSSPVHQAVKVDVPDVAPDAVTAQINARISRHRVEVLSERTETTQVFINPNGSVTRSTAAAPVRVKDSSAKDGWAEVDLDLHITADGSIAPKVPLTDITLSGGAGDPSDLVAYSGPKGKTFSLDWEGPLPKPTLDGSVATYADVAPDVDLQVTATRFGFEESFIVKRRPADPTALDLPLSVRSDGLTVTDPEKSAASGMSVKDAGGHTVGSLSPAMTWDASMNRGGQPGNVTVSDLSLDTTAAGTSLVVTPDPEYLADPDTQYPVVVDPSFTVPWQTSISDIYVKSDAPSTNYDNSSDLYVGTFNGGGSVSRTYLNFAGVQIDNTLVTSAFVKVWDSYSWSCKPSALDVFAASATDYSIATWNSYQPTIVTATKSSITAAAGYSSACGAGWLTMDATKATQYWVGQHSEHFYYGLRASETDNVGWKRFDSSQTVHVPVLEVNYDHYPQVPSGMYVLPMSTWGGSGYTPSETPTLFGSTSDPEGQPARLNYEVWDGPSTVSSALAATCSSAFVVNNAAASCVPWPELADTKTYYVRAQAQSAYADMYSGWSDLSAVTFRTSLNDPQAPSITCGASFPDGSWAGATPQNDVPCTITTTSGNGFSAPVVVSGDIDGISFSQQIPMGAAANFQVSVPKTSGQHTIRAQSYSAVGRTQASPTTYTLGYGTPSISTLAPGATTTNYVGVNAAAPPRGSSSVSATLRWRVAGTPNWSNDISVTGSAFDAGNGSSPVTVNNFRWSTLAATGQGINARRPTLLDFMVCFTYSSPATTRCTDGSGRNATVLRLPHAFGDSFPTTTAGEGTLALWTGELALDETDASIATNLGTLAIGRSHTSFLDTQDSVTGVFGPGWSASFGDDEDAISLQVKTRRPSTARSPSPLRTATLSSSANPVTASARRQSGRTALSATTQRHRVTALPARALAVTSASSSPPATAA